MVRLTTYMRRMLVALAVTSAVGLTAAMPASGSQAQASPSPQPAVTQAPALPGAQPISANDRVYTADQDSNTVSVINPKTATAASDSLPASHPLLEAIGYRTPRSGDTPQVTGPGRV
jgi:hypothetical protein